MSYQEIEVTARYSIKCHDCVFVAIEPTAGRAERVAHDHINFEVERTGTMPNYNHLVSIIPVTVVGRNQ